MLDLKIRFSQMQRFDFDGDCCQKIESCFDGTAAIFETFHNDIRFAGLSNINARDRRGGGACNITGLNECFVRALALTSSASQI